MGLIDAEALRFLRAGMFEFVPFRLGRIPEHGLINGGYFEVLDHTLDPRRYPVNSLSAGNVHRDLDGV
jgi:hypothetical protein